MCLPSTALGGIAEASQLRAPRAPRVRHGMVSPKRPEPWMISAHLRAGWVGGRETRNAHLVPPGVCGSWPLLAVWDPRFSWAHHETRNAHLVPPGVCGSWPLLAVWDPRFSWAHRQPTASLNLSQQLAKVICDTMTLTPKCQRFNSSSQVAMRTLCTKRSPKRTRTPFHEWPRELQ